MKLTHIVMVRLTPGFVTEEYFRYTVEQFDRLVEAVPGLLDARVERNCVAREGNYDLCIRLTLSDESVLGEYLAHPLHREFVDSHAHALLGRASIDFPREK